MDCSSLSNFSWIELCKRKRQLNNNKCFDACFTISGDIRNDVYVTVEKGEFEKGDNNVIKFKPTPFYIRTILDQIPWDSNAKLVIIEDSSTTSKRIAIF